MTITKRPSMLMILDGFGINPDDYGNAIKKANTPNLDEIFARYPKTTLDASGLRVGLPDGQMGNSEVGHLNIGAGRIVYQDLTAITRAIEDGEFFENKALLSAVDHVKTNGSALHIMGLMSDGGVHSHWDHIKALVVLAKRNGIERVYVHAFMDGRDTAPTSGAGYIRDFESFLAKEGVGMLATVSGRYYAMDRDKRWERARLAYDCLVLPAGNDAQEDPVKLVTDSYEAGKTDEFVLPRAISGYPGMGAGDAVIFANFRADRARQLTRIFTDPDFEKPSDQGGQGGFERITVIENLKFVCMTVYDAALTNVEIAFPPKDIKNTLGAYISSLGMRQLRIAETEKYAHVTFFFNGGVETPSSGEDRALIPSPKVATYDLMPEMSAYPVTEEVIRRIETDEYDVIILNFANSDMVGHTGVLNAAVKAVETLDVCVRKIADAVLKAGGQILLTADHGNSDVMLDEKGEPMTAHSTNPVPLVHISSEPAEFKPGRGKLGDIAPTFLTLMGIEVPEEMTGEILVK